MCACAVSLALASVPSRTGVTRAQTDGVASLLRSLEHAVQSGDARVHRALLSETADAGAAAAFAAAEFPRGLTRVVLQERDRQPLTGTSPGSGHRLVVEAFEQSGDRARVATWQIDVKRAGGLQLADDWRIAGEQRITAVESMYRLSINPAKQFSVRNATIATDDLTLRFSDGSAFVAEIDRGVVAMVVLGHGDMRFRPGPETERAQVRIFSGAETLETKCDSVYLRMNPAEFATLLADGHLTPTAVDPRDLRRADEVFHEELPKSFGLDLSDLSREPWSILPPAGDFLAEIHTAHFETLTYGRASNEPEDLSLFDRKHRLNIALYRSARKIAEQGSLYNGDVPSDVDVLDYDIDVTSDPDRQWLAGRATMVLRVQALRINTITLHLASPLVVQSVVSREYGRLFAVRVKNQNSLLINLPAVMPRGTKLSLTISYAGRLDPQAPDREAATFERQWFGGDPSVMRPEPHAVYSSGSYWYPQPAVADYATATMRITVPAGLDCVASGGLAEGTPTTVEARAPAKPQKVYVFQATQPVRYLSFVVSRFVRAGGRRVEFPGNSALDLTVDAVPRQVSRGRALVDRAADIATFYQSLLGDVPYPSLTVALVESDLPGGHSPAYVAVVNQLLPTAPLYWGNDPAAFANYPDYFLAHELAHQWWGQAVGWRNYHEQWLSEGFAQYFAALYAERERGGEAFDGIMRQMKKGAMAQSAQGPISLGYRLGHVRGDSRVFRAVVYNKSAVVLHMLRRLMGDASFFRGVRRFYLASRFQTVGTNELRAAMEAEGGQGLERFFERWIQGARLPRVRFSSRVEGSDVVLRVEQVGDVFDFPLTVTLQYADKKPVDVTIAVTEQIVERRLPLAGNLHRADVSAADGSLVDTIRN